MNKNMLLIKNYGYLIRNLSKEDLSKFVLILMSLPIAKYAIDNINEVASNIMENGYSVRIDKKSGFFFGKEYNLES